MQPEDHRHSASATVLLKASGFRGVIFIYLKDTTQRQIRILSPRNAVSRIVDGPKSVPSQPSPLDGI